VAQRQTALLVAIWLAIAASSSSCGPAMSPSAVRDAAADAAGLDVNLADAGGGDAEPSCEPTERRCAGACAPCPGAGTAGFTCDGARCVATACSLGFGWRDGHCHPWSIEVLPIAGGVGDLALAADGTLHVAVAGEDGVSYLSRAADGVVATEQVTITTAAFSAAWLELDLGARPTLLAMATDTHELELARREVGGWSVEHIGGISAVAGQPDLALARSYNPTLCAFDASDGLLQLHWRSATVWRSEVVDPARPGAGHCALATARAGGAHLAYEAAPGEGLVYARRDESGWRSELLDARAELGSCVALALDRAGRPHIGHAGDGNLHYTSWSGTTWEHTLVDTEAGPGGCLGVALALDAEERPHLSYADWDEGSYNLKYARWTGARWSVDRVDDGFDGRSALALDRRGRPYLLYGREGAPCLARLP